MADVEKPTITHASIFHEFISSIHRVGLIDTFLLTISRGVDFLFDWKYGLDTSKRVELSALDIKEGNTSHGSPYQPTGVLAFRKALRAVSIPQPVTFVDYGSGKGRTLVLAAMAGFENVIGIEFSSELCDSASDNLEKTKAIFPNKQTETAVVCIDAVKYQYTDKENVFYFFYPFDNTLMKRVFTTIEASIVRNPRDAIIIEYVPLSITYTSFSESNLFELEKSLTIFGYKCSFYRTKPQLESK